MANAQGLPPTERVPGLAGQGVDLDVSGDRWAVVFSDGSVRVRNPGGSDYRLRPLRRDESDGDDALLRVENLLDDVSSIEDGALEEIDIGDGDDDVVDAIANDIGDDSADRLEELLQGETSIDANEALSGAFAIVRWGVGDRIAVSRADGVWTSEDAGRRWDRITRVRAVAMADTGSEWVLILENGDYYIEGVRDRIWLGPMPLEIADLDASDGTVWAATDLGLWAYKNSQWLPVGDDLEAMSQIVADPGWEGGLWSYGVLGIRRSDDGGETWRPLPGGPRRGRLAWGGPFPGGGLLVLENVLWQHSEGAWTRDGRKLDRAVYTSGGLFALAQGAVLAPPLELNVADADVIPEWIPLNNLMYTALNRKELVAALGTSRVLQTLMPELVIEGQFSPDTRTNYLPFTTAETGRDLRGMVRLTWTPAGRSAAGEAFEQTVEEISLRTGFDDIGIAGDRGLLGAMGGRVGRTATNYRSKLADDVRDLYAARNALYFERAAVPPQTLAEEVTWQLRLQELEARLDALTDGAVSAWNLDAG